MEISLCALHLVCLGTPVRIELERIACPRAAARGHFSLYEVSQGIDLGWGACDRGNGVGVGAVQVASEVGGSLRRNNAKASAIDSELEVFIEGLGEVVPINLELNV